MVVYGDILFALNLLLDYCLLLATAKIAGVAFVRLRLLLAAGFGALYALSVFLPKLQFLSALPIRLVMGGVMVLIAFGWRSALPRLTIVFAAVSAALGGGVLALTTVGSATLYQGFATTGADLTAVILAGSLGCAGLSVVFRRQGRARTYIQIAAQLNGHTTSFRALVDTGNALTDRNDRRVIVADWQTVAALLPGLEQRDAARPAEAFARLAEYAGPGRLTLLSYHTVGVSDGLMLALRPERVTLDGRYSPGLLIAASPHPVSPDGSYQGLIGVE